MVERLRFDAIDLILDPGNLAESRRQLGQSAFRGMQNDRLPVSPQAQG
jgi:hypothetical protein